MDQETIYNLVHHTTNILLAGYAISMLTGASMMLYECLIKRPVVEKQTKSTLESKIINDS